MRQNSTISSLSKNSLFVFAKDIVKSRKQPFLPWMKMRVRNNEVLKAKIDTENESSMEIFHKK